MVHEKPGVRTSWGVHAKEGFYNGPALKHYRCYKVHITEIGQAQISDRVVFFPEHTMSPTLSDNDTAAAAATELTRVLKTQA